MTCTRAEGKSRSRISMTGQVRITSPILEREMTRMSLTKLGFKGFPNIVHRNGMHAYILGAGQMITRGLVAPDIMEQDLGLAHPPRPGDRRVCRPEHGDGPCPDA